jgi:VanZ family protein
MKLLGFLLIWALAIPAMRGTRWAYVAFVVLSLLYFPASRGFRVDPHRCDLTVDLPLAVQSLSNYGHIIPFSIFFLMTTMQLRMSGWQRFGWSIGLTMAMGAAVEIAEGLSGAHHCKAIDLIPDFIGVLLGLGIIVLAGIIAGAKVSRRNGDNGPLRGQQTVV